MSNIKNLLSEAVSTIPSWQQWCCSFILFLSSLVSSENVSRIDVKLLCHGITLRQAQICPDLPSLSEPALSAIACDVCRQGSFGFNFKVFYSVFLLHFVPLALRLHAVRACKRYFLWMVFTWCGEERVEVSKRRSSIQLHSCCSLDSFSRSVWGFEAKQSRRHQTHQTQRNHPVSLQTFSLFLPDNTRFEVVLTLTFPLPLLPHGMYSPSQRHLMVSQCSVYFTLSRLLGDFVSAKARRWEGKAVESCPGFSFLDWRARFFFNENRGREKRLRDNIFPERSWRGKSYNGALTMQRPILVLESALWLMCFGGAGGSVWYCITPPAVCWNLRLLQPLCASLVVCSPSKADSSQACLWEQELELRSNRTLKQDVVFNEHKTWAT